MKQEIFKVLVPSKSVPGDYHEVLVFKGGSMKCNCVGSMFTSNCRHVKKVKKHLLSKCLKENLGS